MGGERRSEWVFPNERGGPLDRQNYNKRSWRPMLDRTKLPPFGFHVLRHTHATLLLAQNTHPRVVQERLGHASIGITMDLYSHSVPLMGRAAADALDALFGTSAATQSVPGAAT